MRLIVGCLYLALIGCGPSLQEIENEVAEEAARQYQIVKAKGGSRTDLCVQAGIVAAAYLQAENPSKYEIWKIRERTDCAAARLGVQ